VHVHIGSGSDPQEQEKATKAGLEIVNSYSTVRTLDMGGGIKVGRMSYETGTDIADLGNAMTSAIVEFEESTGRSLRLEIEPGTAAVANAGYIIAKVIDVKHTEGLAGQNFIIVDAGMNVNSRPVLYGSEHPIVIFPQDSTERIVKEYLVFGPCCETGDAQTLSTYDPNTLKLRPLIEAKEKDLAGIGGAGAYCASMALQNYNSLERPPEIWVGLDGSITEITPRQNIREVWEREAVPLFVRGR
jgi:diaminopimelate decarboxylase